MQVEGDRGAPEDPASVEAAAEPITAANLFKFIVPSLLGVGLFLTPVRYQGNATVVLGVLVGGIQAAMGSSMEYATTAIFVSAAVLTLLYTVAPDRWTDATPRLRSALRTQPGWLVLRVLGGVFSAMTLLQLGPEWVISKKTGVTAYVDIAGIIFCLIGLGCLLLPLLTDYGFLEFIGTMLRRIFMWAFGLPGRASIDAAASWVGSSSIAVLVTSRQYDTGHYSKREAAVIATNFSVVSVPFVALTVEVAGISGHFLQLYASMLGIGVLCAVVTPRIPPLSRIPDDFHPEIGKQVQEEVGVGYSLPRWALRQAARRAAGASGPVRMLRNGGLSALDLFFTMMPAAMTIEFLALATYHHTGILQVLTLPLVPVLELLGVSEAAAASPGVVIGLLDQFVPAIIAGEIDDPGTSFVLAGLSVTQLIFFAETAILIMRSGIPLSVRQLVTIFCIRTTIALPLLAAIAHFIF
jgi:nucleoside recognition membrane protein YjiH